MPSILRLAPEEVAQVLGYEVAGGVAVRETAPKTV